MTSIQDFAMPPPIAQQRQGRPIADRAGYRADGMAHGASAAGGPVIAAPADGAEACLAWPACGRTTVPGRRPLGLASHSGKRLDAPMRGGALRVEPAR